MNSERFLRVLKRGGCAIQNSAGDWSVKRTSDARGTTIGRLDTETVASLCRMGHLKRLGDFDPMRLIWGGGEMPETTIRTASLQAVTLIRKPVTGGSLIDRCLRAVSCEHACKRLSAAVTAYREDVMQVSHGGHIAGMNWRGLTLGTRINGHGSRDQPLSNRYAGEARWRLQRIHGRFGSDRLRELNSVVIDEVTRNRFSETFDISRRKTEARALAHLDLLADIYDQDMSVPDGV